MKMNKFFKKYIRPFWFSSGCSEIKPPYVYGFFLMTALFVCIAGFLIMASKKYDAKILAVLASVIATLAGLYAGVVRLHDKGRQEKKITENKIKELNNGRYEDNR